jgi:hypothetical protein
MKSQTKSQESENLGEDEQSAREPAIKINSLARI